jgi:hypothetical protein
MKLTPLKNGGLRIDYEDSNELLVFCDKCYKPYQKSSISYFAALFDNINEVMEDKKKNIN